MLYDVFVTVKKTVEAENEKQAQDAVTSKLNYFDYFDAFQIDDTKPAEENPDEQ